MKPDDARIAEVLMELAHRRGTDSSFCPSEAARTLATEWRPLMTDVRRVAAGLPLVATQKGKTVDPADARGPVRLRLTP